MGTPQYKPCESCGENMGKYSKGNLCRGCLNQSPTPEEIADAKEKIQAEWNEKTKWMRQVYHVEPWTPPNVKNHGQEPSE